MKTTKSFRDAIERLLKKYDADLSEPGAMLKLTYKNDTYMPLVIIRDVTNVLRVAHYGSQNGDRMADPEMTFWTFNGEEFGWVPMEWRNDYVGSRTVSTWLEKGDIARFSLGLQREHCSVANMWARNIKDQGWHDPANVTATYYRPMIRP